MITILAIYLNSTLENILTQKRKCTQSDARYQVNSLRPRLHCTGFAGHDIFVCSPGATFNNKDLLFR